MCLNSRIFLWNLRSILHRNMNLFSTLICKQLNDFFGTAIFPILRKSFFKKIYFNIDIKYSINT